MFGLLIASERMPMDALPVRIATAILRAVRKALGPILEPRCTYVEGIWGIWEIWPCWHQKQLKTDYYLKPGMLPMELA